ncbi:MAG: leucine-rich repeat domain-containing protein [Bdellovibrionota bacterium]
MLKPRTMLLICIQILIFMSEAQAFVSVCDRTILVREALEVFFRRGCGTITEKDLLQIERLKIYGGKASEPPLKAGDFDGLREVKLLRLIGSGSGLPSGIFSGLDKLETLTIEDSKLSIIPDDMFSKLENLKWLVFERNHIRKVSERAFSGMPKLEMLAMQLNRIGLLPHRLFPDTSFVATVSLYGNEISRLPEGFFTGLPRLKELLLTRNKLKRLPDKLFVGLTALLTLDLEKNLLKTIPAQILTDLPNLRRINLDQNPIDPSELRKLKALLGDKLSFCSRPGKKCDRVGGSMR